MKPKPSALESYTRLAVGSAFLLLDQINRAVSSRAAKLDIVEPDGVDLNRPAPLDDDTVAGIVGIVYDAGSQLQDSLSRLDRLTAWTYKRASRFFHPLVSSRLARPLTGNFDRLAARGEQVWNRWVDLGRAEHRQDRAIAGQVANESIDYFIDHLTENQEIRELIQSQSAGLANEIVKELRERGVSADNYLEAFVRHVLRLAPRNPEVKPPEEVIQIAHPLRQIHGRIYHE